MIVGTILFFVDMNEGATSAVRQLYGFASENFQKTIDQPFYFAVNAL